MSIPQERIKVRAKASPEELLKMAAPFGKHMEEALERARTQVVQGKHQIAPWQGGWLYALASRLDGYGRTALEIGTALGYSAFLIGSAMPHSWVTTLNPSDQERALAKKALRNLVVECRGERSWDYLARTTETYDLIFVDGDHKQVERDLPWFNRLRPNGLFLFHDYSPRGKRICLPVYEAVRRMANGLGRIDVELFDLDDTGLAGFYRQEGETWPIMRS